MMLHHFNRAEFIRDATDWWPLMNLRLLVLLDVYRHQRGRPVAISPHPRALGRPNWPNANSDHAVDVRGTVDAADVLPAGLVTRADAERELELARSIGFTALGLYPHWRPSAGLHLGLRPGQRMGNPATWGAILIDGEQTYVSLDHALDHMPDEADV